MRSPIKVVKHKTTPGKSNCNLQFPISHTKTWENKKSNNITERKKWNINQVDDIVKLTENEKFHFKKDELCLLVNDNEIAIFISKMMEINIIECRDESEEYEFANITYFVYFLISSTFKQVIMKTGHSIHSQYRIVCVGM